MCRGKSCFTLVNLCLSSLPLCSLCSKSNGHTSLSLLSWDIFCFSFLKITQFSQGLRVLFTPVENTARVEICCETKTHVLNSILQLDGFILCFCVRWELQPVNPATDVQIRGSARRLLSLAWCPKITFEHARPCLVEYLMRDEECLKNRGDVKVLGVPFLWHYLEWDLLRVGKTGAPQTSQEKGEITLIKEKNRILLQSYSSSARRAT